MVTANGKWRRPSKARWRRVNREWKWQKANSMVNCERRTGQWQTANSEQVMVNCKSRTAKVRQG
ncbi:hypothetical protein PAXRUDRAFT_768938, partial [Paxillus rubicundulus Ve08.2h10]